MQGCPIRPALIDHLPHVNSISYSLSNCCDVSSLTSNEQILCRCRHNLVLVNFEFSVGEEIEPRRRVLPTRSYYGIPLFHGLATMPHPSRLRMRIKNYSASSVHVSLVPRLSPSFFLVRTRKKEGESLGTRLCACGH